MPFISIFDIIGPNMVGPSSSHTSGAVTIGNIARNIFGKEIKKVSFTLYGSFEKTHSGHGTDRALLAGVLGFLPDDLRIRNSFDIAKKYGIEYKFIKSDTKVNHPNTAEICMENDLGEKTIIRGVSIGGGKVKIIKINDTKVEFFGEFPTLIINHKDKNGVISHITKCLANFNVNIGNMNVNRENKGSIVTSIIELDEKIPCKLIENLRKNSDIVNVMLIQI